MFKSIKVDLEAVTFDLHRLWLALNIWSCHVWVAPTFRLSDHRIDGNRMAAIISWAKARTYLLGRVWTSSLPHSSSGSSGTPSPTLPPGGGGRGWGGFTLIELILVMVVIGILAATVLPRIDFGGTSSMVSVDGAAYMIASDIRYVQEFAMANRVSKSIIFTNGSPTYTFNPTNSFDPSGQLQSIGAIIGTTVTFTFNSLGEPIAGGGSSVTVSAGGVTRTITVTQYTGKASIS